MATTNADHTDLDNSAIPNGEHSTNAHDFEKATRGMSHEEKNVAQHAARFGYGPLAHMRTNNDATLPGEIRHRLGCEQIANPVILSLWW
jgi:hypothetical protein